MATITLWQRSSSPPSWAVRMMAKILGLKVELKVVDFMVMEHKSPEYRKMNPMGTMPVMKDGDFVISESHATIKYLLDKYGNDEQKKLYPSNREERALVDQVSFFDTGVAFLKIKSVALPVLFDGVSELTPKVIKEVEDVYEIVEMYLDGKDYVANKEFTIADISLGCTIIALNSLYPVDTARYPQTIAWLNRLHAKPFFQEIAVPGSKDLSGIVKSVMEKNKAKK